MKIKIICQSQFGYHLDTWYYAKHLKSHIVEYVGWDYGFEKKEIDGVSVLYLGRSGGRVIRFLMFIVNSIKIVNADKPDRVFIKYFFLCSLIKIFSVKTTYIVDIRTGDVNKNSLRRYLSDFIMKIECKFFSNVTVISSSLKKKLKLTDSAYILPLGAEVISSSMKPIDNINLLYVGTLTGRQLHKTIIGLKKYCNERGEDKITYSIVGDGWGNELLELKSLTKELCIEHIVNFYGFVHHKDITDIFDKCNVGVSFVPITDYFNVQPATKTYEYLLSNMFVIATKTNENSLLLSENNNDSILIDDTSNSFFEALCKIDDNKELFNARDANPNLSNYEWKCVVYNFESYLKEL